jgi:type I restriction enzyme S subunit
MMKRRGAASPDVETTPTERSELPPGWCWVSLGELASPEGNSITDGPFGSNLKTEHYTSSGPRVVRLQNIGDGVFRDVSAYISENHFKTLLKHQVNAGDLVIAALGESLPRACVIPAWLGAAIVKADCIRFKPDERLVSSVYLNYALNNEDARRRTSAIIHGVGRPRLNLTEIKSILVPLAPPPEQIRLVAKIEELLSDLDAGVSSLERARANLKKYRAAVLRAAVTGELTAEWRAAHPNVEPAHKLLERILPERGGTWVAKFSAKNRSHSGRQTNFIEPAATTGEPLPELPPSWCWVRVEQLLSEPICNGISVKGSSEPPGVPALRLNAMSDKGFNYAERRYIPISTEVTAALRVCEGDFFIARGNGSLHLVGRGTLAQQPRETIVFPDTMIRVRLTGPQSIRRFVNLIWGSQVVRGQIEKKARTTAGIYKISQEDIKGFLIPLPPEDEQVYLLAEADRHLSVIEAADNYIAASLKRAARLRQSILKEAFAGRLVPQDPNDEPVSVLLDRIRQTRPSAESANGKAKPRTRKPRQPELFE